MRRASLLSFVTACAAVQSATVSVDWSTVVRPLKTQVAFQTVVRVHTRLPAACLPVVQPPPALCSLLRPPSSPSPAQVNPVTARESPYHDAVYEKIASLQAPYQRYVPWLPYPRMGIAELEPPSTGGLCGFVNSGGPRASGAIWSTTLDCGARNLGTIDSVVFANYGQPTGFCNALKAAPACSRDVRAAVSAACLGKAACTLTSNDETFGAAPCSGSRLAVEVTCSANHSAVYTYWDFKLLDEGMLDFLTAANSSGRSAIPNFSTIPNWQFLTAGNDRSYFPDDPLGETWSYEQGSAFRDDTLLDLGDYYGRLVAHYVEGGFVDEAGNFIPGYNLTISHWEVLNECVGGARWRPRTSPLATAAPPATTSPPSLAPRYLRPPPEPQN